METQEDSLDLTYLKGAALGVNVSVQRRARHPAKNALSGCVSYLGISTTVTESFTC